MHGNSRTKSSEAIVLPAFFFGNLYPSGKYTSKKKPAKPQSTKNSPFSGLFDAKYRIYSSKRRGAL